MKGFNLYSFNLDLNSSLLEKPLTLIPLHATNQSVAMGITETCKMIPDVKSALNRKSTYADIRSEVMTENKVGNINPHSPNYQFVDKTAMPLVLNIGCGTLVSTAVSAGCSLAYSVGVRSLDPTSFKGSLVIGATSLLATSIAQALLKERVLQKGGIKVGKDIAESGIKIGKDITESGIKIGKDIAEKSINGIKIEKDIAEKILML